MREMVKYSISALFIAVLLSACAVQATSAPSPTPSLAATPTTATTPTLTASQQELASKILNTQGATTVHDPSMIKDGDTYYVFSTGPGITIRCSNDMLLWDDCGRVFTVYPDWVTKAIPEVKDLWAPDISFRSGKYYLYYSASTFGSNRSVIGLATNGTLDQKSPNYNWVDQGEVISSEKSDDYNAIDPNLSIDKDGQPWLAFGSFWSGIKLVKLDPATGKPAEGSKPISLANHPGSDAIEGAFITRRGDFYYLFVSYDFCCQGKLSTYNIRVGRSKDITGPYVDRDGHPMIGGGGTLVYKGSTRWRGPGHNAIYIEKDTYYLVYHSYDADFDGTPTLRIEQLIWDQDGWPQSPSALIGQ